ncbi:MAG: TadE/TadG family type IV pilus assembly protein [Nitrososphaera sp.]
MGTVKNFNIDHMKLNLEQVSRPSKGHADHLIVIYLKSHRGQGVVEFTLAALLFFSVIFAIVEFSHLFYVRLTLQHALKEAARYMVTGRTDDPNDPATPFPDRPTAIEEILKRNLIGTGVGLGPVTLNPSDGGLPGQTVTLTVEFTKPWFTGLFGSGGVPFSLSTTWKNEPFG